MSSEGIPYLYKKALKASGYRYWPARWIWIKRCIGHKGCSGVVYAKVTKHNNNIIEFTPVHLNDDGLLQLANDFLDGVIKYKKQSGSPRRKTLTDAECLSIVKQMQENSWKRVTFIMKKFNLTRSEARRAISIGNALLLNEEVTKRESYY